MPANTAPIFTLTPIAKSASITTSGGGSVAAVRDASSGTISSVAAAGTSGTRIDRITATGTGTTAATQILLFITDGVTTWLFKELTLAAVAAGVTTAAATVELIRTDGLPVVMLASGWSLKFGSTVLPTSGNIIVTAFGGDF